MQLLSSARSRGRSPGDLRRVKFPPRRSFHSDLNRRVDQYFEGSARSRHGGWAMGLKSIAMISWLAASYAVLLFAPVRAWEAVLLAVSIGFALAGVGFSVMHDANHGGTSSSARANAILSFTLDLIGGSSYVWRSKHNVLHHTYTNISTLDPDLEGGGPVLRLAEWQPRYAHHRYQHVYIWIVYGLFPLKWWFLDDFHDLFTGRIGGHQFPRARGRALFVALLGKALFITWAVALPFLLHPSWALAGLWTLSLFVLGNVLAAVFQLAHCVEKTEFLEADGIERDWAEHQLATTMDFAPRNSFLAWYLGGLNFQVEHHLFPRICHVHYPALSRIVEETCRAHGLRYRCEPTLRGALGANWRWLRHLGAPAPA
jgi:linoleoyl-CoA desaturase